MPLILPANTLSAAGYDVANSCRFNDDDGDNLSKAYGGASDTNFTWSAWIKRCSPGGGTEAVFHIGMVVVMRIDLLFILKEIV